jgi:hypothetical protein
MRGARWVTADLLHDAGATQPVPRSGTVQVLGAC